MVFRWAFNIVLKQFTIFHFIIGACSLYNQTYGNLTIFNHTLHEIDIVIEDIDAYFAMSIINMSNITITGQGLVHEVAKFNNCVFEGSRIFLRSIRDCNVHTCHFKTESLPDSGHRFDYMLNVYSLVFLSIAESTFGEADENLSLKTNETHLGIRIENVLHSMIRNTFLANVLSNELQGTVIYITNSTLDIDYCQFYYNSAKRGIIVAENSVKMTISKSSFVSNHVVIEGLLLLLWHTTLVTQDSIYHNNKALGYFDVCLKRTLVGNVVVL